eukprot:380406_1
MTTTNITDPFYNLTFVFNGTNKFINELISPDKRFPGGPDFTIPDEFTLQHNPTVHGVTLALVLIGVLIYIPFCLYIAYPLFHRRNDIILRKRYVTLSIFAVVILLSQILFVTVQQVFAFEVVDDDNGESHFYQSLFSAGGILNCLYLFTELVFISIIALRFWLIYYDTNYIVVMCNDQWKGIIAQSYNTTNNFFITHKATLGNQKFLLKWVMFDFVLGVIFIPLLMHFDQIWLIFAWMVIFYIGFLMTLRKLKALSFYDEFHILEEFRLIGIAISSLILIWIITVVALVIAQSMAADKMRNTAWITVFMFLDHQMRIWYNIWCIYIMTRWVINKIKNDPAIRQQYSQTSETIISAAFANANTKKGDQMESIKLDQMLTNNEHFTCFMKHLANEFSMELLLSLVEFIQFKQLIYEQIQDTSTDPAADIELAKCIPQSSIVHDSDDELEVKALKLYNKYVAVSSEWEINVHSAVRQQLVHRFEANYHAIEWTPTALYIVFDDCLQEMMKLLRYSLTRFKTKPEYIRLQGLQK